jgi:hypothetical protein
MEIFLLIGLFGEKIRASRPPTLSTHHKQSHEYKYMVRKFITDRFVRKEDGLHTCKSYSKELVGD